MKLLIHFFLLISVCCFAQSGGTPLEETEKRGTIKIEKSNCVRLNDSVFAYVDSLPQFPGGVDALYQWMNKNVKYPRKALEEERFGTVFCSFIILKDGSITDINILKCVYSDFEAEAMRLIKSMPDWIPGRCGGTLVNVKVNFPINFVLK